MTTKQASVRLAWKGAHRFEAGVREHTVMIDGAGETGPTPPEVLLEAVGACAAIDVVDILEKGRQTVRELDVEVTGRRHDGIPAYFEALTVRFRISGDVAEAKARRAAQLSFDRYCSVFLSLRPDLALEIETVVEP